MTPCRINKRNKRTRALCCVLSTRDAAALLCQLLRHGDHRRRSLPRLERRHHPRIPWKRKSAIPGADSRLGNRLRVCDSLAHSLARLSLLPPLLPVCRSTSGSPGWRRRRRRSRMTTSTEAAAAVLARPHLLHLFPFVFFLFFLPSTLESPRLINPLPACHPAESPSLVEVAVLESLYFV